MTNDDGVEAKGIKALSRILKEVKGVNVTVVAPDREQSATSHALTLHRPLRVVKKRKDVYAVDGTPTDCVFIGVSAILNFTPDVIFSGINAGGNLGDDIHYSGTVSAAVEGGLMGIPSVALSQMGMNRFNFSVAAQFAKKLLRLIRKHGLPRGVVLNVNVPENARDLDFEVTKTGKRDYGSLSVKKHDPRGRPYYWIGGNRYNFFDIKGSDCNAVLAGKISITPLHVNMTSLVFLNKMKSWKMS